MASTRLLVVEDESVVAKDLANRLNRLGYEVVGTAATGERAIQLAAEHRPDLILMDIMLKGEMDGIEAAERIQESLDTAVVYLTAYSDDETLARAKMTAPYGYMLKPFAERELHTAVETALYRHSMEQELKHRVALEGLVTGVSADLVNRESREIDQGVDLALERLGKFAQADRAYVFLYSEDLQTMDNTHEWCEPGTSAHIDELKGLARSDYPWWSAKLNAGEYIQLSSLDDLPAEAAPERAVLAAQGIQSAMIAPISVRGVPFGFLGLDAVQQTREWPADLAPLLKVAGDIIGGAVARAHADEGLRAARDELEKRILERTMELSDTNAHLKAEIAKREEAEETRRLLETQLGHAQRLESIGTLAGGIAHDFNNLLTVIVCGSELLLDRNQLEPDVSVQIREIHEQGRRGATLVRQILDFSRRSGTDQRVMDLRRIVDETTNMLRRTIPASIAIHASTHPTELTVKADPTQIQQVLTNLAVNARDAMPDGGELTVAVEPYDVSSADPVPVAGMTPGPWLRMMVRDTGEGMQPDVVDRVFEPFFTTKEVGKGTGLGLSQVYGIVRLHGGFINVTSEPGQGSAFNVYLPALSQQTLGIDEAGRAPSIPRGNGQEILLVEDETPVRTVIENMLRQLNYSPITATDGQDAVEAYLARRGSVALVLTDVVMPRMGGLELSRKLRTQDPEARVLLMSGYPLEEHSADLTEMGIAGSLLKPILMANLAEEVSKALST